MDLNLTILAGRLAADPERRTFDSGALLLRLLVTVRQDEPRRRIDVVPVTWWDPDEDFTADAGDRVWISGAVQRRFFDEGPGRRSRIEVVASQVIRQGAEVTA